MEKDERIEKMKELYDQAIGFCIGKKLDDVKDEISEKGWEYRIREEDGEHFVGTDDLHYGRLNFVISKGVITAAFPG